MDAAQDSDNALPLIGAQETLLVTLLAKYNDFYQPRPLLTDRWAVAVIDHLGAEQHAALTARISRGPTSHPATVTMRARTIDNWATDFLASHSNEPVTVVHLACGLDARALRLRGKCSDKGVRWVDLDLPEVIDARHRASAAMPSPPGGRGYSYEMVAADATATEWLQAIPADRPTLVIMEGLSMYLGVEAAEALMQRLVSHFAARGGELVLDTMSPQFAAFMNWVIRVQKNFDFQFGYTLSSPAEILRLNERLQIVEGHTFTDNPAIKLLGWQPRVFLWVMSWIPYAGALSRFMRFKM